MNMLEKMKEKSKGDLSPEKAQALKSMLANLKSMVGSGLAEKMKGLKKVTVASDSPEGLKEGLEVAKEKVDEVEDKADSMEHEKSESPEKEMKEEIQGEDSVESAEMNDEQKIAELEKQIEELKNKKKNTDLASAKESLKSVF